MERVVALVCQPVALPLEGHRLWLSARLGHGWRISWPGGPALAAQAIQAGLVDEIHLFVTPIVGGGNPFLPNIVRLKLELLDERRFGKGALHLHYRTIT